MVRRLALWTERHLGIVCTGALLSPGIDQLFDSGGHGLSCRVLCGMWVALFRISNRPLWGVWAAFTVAEGMAGGLSGGKDAAAGLMGWVDSTLLLVASCMAGWLVRKRLKWRTMFSRLSGFQPYVLYTVGSAICFLLIALPWKPMAAIRPLCLAYLAGGLIVIPVVVYASMEPQSFWRTNLLDILIVNAVVFFVLLRVYIPGYQFYKYLFGIFLNSTWALTNRLDRALSALSSFVLYMNFLLYFHFSPHPQHLEILFLSIYFAGFMQALSISFFQDLGQNKIIHQKVKVKTSFLNHEKELLERSQALLIQEQLSAKKIFDRLVYAGSLNRQEIRYRLSPHSIFNGDVLLAQEKPDGNLSVLLGDFTGHGLPAAMGIMPCSEIFYSMMKKGFSLEQVIAEINRKLGEVLPEGIFCAAVAFEINFWEKNIKCWNGGVPEPILFDEKSEIKYQFASRNIPLGFFKCHEFRPKFDVVSFEYGDRLLMFSDGVLEARNTAGELLGKDRILRLFTPSNPADAIFDRLIQKVFDFQSEDKSERDDLTICEIKMYAPFITWTQKTENPYPCGSALDWGFTLELPVLSLKKVEPVPIMLHFLLESPHLFPHKERLFLILSELYANALEHGILGLDSQVKSEPNGLERFYQEKNELLARLEAGCITIQAKLEPTETGGNLWITVCDTGKGFDPQSALTGLVKNANPSGRGIALLRQLCASVEYRANGTIATVCYRW